MGEKGDRRWKIDDGSRRGEIEKDNIRFEINMIGKDIHADQDKAL